MCPGQVPGNHSDTASERSTTLAPENDAKSKPPPLPEAPENIPELQCFRTVCPSEVCRNVRPGRRKGCGRDHTYLGGSRTAQQRTVPGSVRLRQNGSR